MIKSAERERETKERRRASEVRPELCLLTICPIWQTKVVETALPNAEFDSTGNCLWLMPQNE